MSIPDTIDRIRVLARSHLPLLSVLVLIAIIITCAVTFDKKLRHLVNMLSRPVQIFLVLSTRWLSWLHFLSAFLLLQIQSMDRS